MNEGTNDILERHGGKARVVESGTGALLECYKKHDKDEKHVLVMALLDTISMFCFELIAMPEDDKWLRKLKLYEKLGHIDLSGFDLEAETDLEYLFIRNIFISASDIGPIASKIGANSEDIDLSEQLLK